MLISHTVGFTSHCWRDAQSCSGFRFHSHAHVHTLNKREGPLVITWALFSVGLAAVATASHFRWSVFLTLVLSMGCVAEGVAVVLVGGTVTTLPGVLALTPLGAWFLALLGIVAAMSSWYRWGYADRSRGLNAWLPLFLLSMMTVILSGNLWVFMTAWEGMTVTSFCLVTLHPKQEGALSAGYIYLVMSQVSAMFILAGFLLIGARLGTFTFSVWAEEAARLPMPTKSLVFALLGLGFAIKSGVVPFHIWLPRAHPAAPAPVSSLMSGAMIKLGIFGLLQFVLLDLGATARVWPLMLLALGAVSSLLGVLYALMEHDLKRLLAYHSIENIGIILLGLGVMGVGIDWHLPVLVSIGFAAAMFHTLNHAIFKSQLFLAAGAVEHHAGTLDADHLGGLIRTVPGLALGFLVGAMAISALPPFNGFASEWLTFRGLLDLVAASGGMLRVVGLGLAMVLALTGALAAVCFVKATGITFLGQPRAPVARRPVSAYMTGPVLSLGLLSLLLGVGAAAVVPVIDRIDPLAAGAAAGQMAPAAPLLLAGVLVVATIGFLALSRVWDVPVVPRWSGGRVPDASMQFTGASFTKAIRTTFAVVYQPHRRLEAVGGQAPDFPARLVYTGGTRPIWERYCYQPAYRAVWWVSRVSTRLQAGPVRLYLAYLLVTVGIMLACLR